MIHYIEGNGLLLSLVLFLNVSQVCIKKSLVNKYQGDSNPPLKRPVILWIYKL